MQKIKHGKQNKPYLTNNGKRLYIDDIYLKPDGGAYCYKNGLKIDILDDMQHATINKIQQFEFIIEMHGGNVYFITAENEQQILDVLNKTWLTVTSIKKGMLNNENTDSIKEQFANYELYL